MGECPTDFGCTQETMSDDFCDFKVDGESTFITWFSDQPCIDGYGYYSCQDMHVPFKLSGGGDEIYIYDGETLMDSYEYFALTEEECNDLGLEWDAEELECDISDVSMSRCEDNSFVYTLGGDVTFNSTSSPTSCSESPSLWKYTDNTLISIVTYQEADNNSTLLQSNNYLDFLTVVDKKSYLDYVILQELRMGNGGIGFNYDEVFVTYHNSKWSFGPLDSLESTLSFYNGFDVNQCQGEEYKVNATTNESQGWLFDNMVNNTLLSNQLYQFITDAVIIVEDPTGGGVERIDTDDDSDLPDENFLTDLITRWNELRGDVLSDENVLYRIDYYYYYLGGRAIMDYQIQDDKESNFDNEINKLKDWLMNRIYWIDHNIRRIKHQVDGVEAAECANNPLTPTNPHGLSYCNDLNATNPNPDSNFNDGTCNYVLNREIQFQLDTKDVGYPKIEKVRLNILTKNGADFDESYEMSESIENIWSYDLFDFLPGDIIEYNYTKETPDVYNVRTGALETDKVRTIQIRDEHQIQIQDTFNDFINEFQETNLPLVSIQTDIVNDAGFIDDDNVLLNNPWYCPGPIDENGFIDNWEEDSAECNALTQYLDTAYFSSKEACESFILPTSGKPCDTDCIDGTNIMDEPKITTLMEIFYNGEGALNSLNDEPQISTAIGIEARGFSSRGFAKKQYAIETQMFGNPQCANENYNTNLFCNGFKPEEGVDYGDECIFDIENDFVLLGPFRDRTYMRNAITYELWDRMENIGSNSKYVEFILNGSYLGLYLMFERPKIDERRVPISTDITDEPDGGWMIKVESGGEQDFRVGYDSYTKYEFFDPDEGDGLSEQSKNDIMTQITTFEKAVDDNTSTEGGTENLVRSLMDVKTFSEYWLIQEFARNNEGFTRSQYWHSFGTGDYAPDGFDNNKIYISFVWDMNHAFAATIIDYDGWATQNFFAIPQVWGNLFKTQWFQEEIYNKYVYFKDELPIFNVSEINKLINKFSNEILSYNAVNRDQKRWYDGEIEDFNIYLKNFRKYILQRIAWMDIHICDGDGTPFLSSDADNFIYNQTTTETCVDDGKNSNFIAIYNPFDGQVFDINDVGNEFEIEIIISYNLLDFIDSINVVILDSFTNSVVHTFEDIEVESDNYVKLIWNTYDRNIRGKLLGDYRIEATIAAISDLEENIKTFSIQNKNIVRGCTDPKSINYDLFAEIDDGSCKYQQDCNLKYNVSEFITDIIYLYPGYNTVSYPLDFTGVDVDLFAVLNNSYYNDDGVRDTFEENDYITAFFDDVVYTATYMGGEWIPSINRGFSLNELSKGIGFILYVSKGGRIIWDIPREEIS